MDKPFSDQLVAKAIKYFETEHGLDILPEEAEQYLGAMADLYLSFCNIPQIENLGGVIDFSAPVGRKNQSAIKNHV